MIPPVFLMLSISIDLADDPWIATLAPVLSINWVLVGDDVSRETEPPCVVSTEMPS